MRGFESWEDGTEKDRASILSTNTDVISGIKRREHEALKRLLQEAKATDKAILLFHGSEGLRSSLKDKLTGMGIVAALLITMTAPACVDPSLPKLRELGPATSTAASNSSLQGASSDEYIARWEEFVYMILNLIATIAGGCCVFTSVMWIDLLSSHCPSTSDVFRFHGLGYTDDPLVWTIVTVVSFFLSIFWAIGVNSSMSFHVSVPVVTVGALIFIIGSFYRYIRLMNNIFAHNNATYGSILHGASYNSVLPNRLSGEGSELVDNDKYRQINDTINE